ncbi:MAG: hypothetical protein ABI423_02845 [Burkholderiales bacterium]
MSSLFLAWQAPTPSRAWFPVGRLDADPRKHLYEFRYIRGALRAQKQVGFEPLAAFPDLRMRYRASELFPLFKNRVLDPSRRDFADYLRSLDLDPEGADPIEILSVSGGERQTDRLEVFPKMEKGPGNSFRCRFFLHGLRHVSPTAQARALELRALDQLQVSVELNNPATGTAIQLTTREYAFLGWAPRYLVPDILNAVEESPEVSAHVVRVNEIGIPLNRRILIELSGKLPPNVEPMSGPDYQFIAPNSTSRRKVSGHGRRRSH